MHAPPADAARGVPRGAPDVVTRPPATPPLLARLTPAAVDRLVTAAVAVVIAVSLPFADEPGARPLDAAGWVLGLATAVPLLWRRRHPVEVLATTAVLSSAYHAAQYPGGPPILALCLALYSTSLAGHRAVAYTVALVGLVASTGYRVLVEGDPVVMVATEAGIVLTIVMAGDLVRTRRAWHDEVHERLRRTAADAEARAQARVTEERLWMARELHDVLAHTVAAITVQAAVADETLDEHPAAAHEALAHIRRSSHEALEELRSTIGTLRSGAGGTLPATPLEPVPSLADLSTLLEHAGAAGLATTLEVEGDHERLPSTVDRAAYRVLQEALTNAARHAGASVARVSVRHSPDALELEVVDDGRGAPTWVIGGGYGLLGMRERVDAVGGSLEAGPGTTGGFRVFARLPVGAAA